MIKTNLTASAITQTALLILRGKQYHCWRQPNWTAGRRKGVVTAGLPDIIGHHKQTGVFMGCEVKTINDTFSEAQIKFLQRLHASGGVALYATEENHNVVIKKFSNFKK